MCHHAPLPIKSLLPLTFNFFHPLPNKKENIFYYTSFEIIGKNYSII